MNRKTSALFTIKALIAPSKVRSPRNSLVAIKTFTSAKNLSTAAETASDNQNPNELNVENPSGYYDYVNHTHTDNPMIFQQNPNNPYPNRQCTNEYNPENGGGYQSIPNENFNIGKFQHSPLDYYNRNTKTYQHQENIGEYQHNLNGHYKENVGKDHRLPNENINNNIEENQLIRKGILNYNDAGKSEQIPVDNYAKNTRTSHHQENIGEYQFFTGYHSKNPGLEQQPPNGNFNNNVGEFHQSPINYYTYQHQTKVGEYQQPPNGNNYMGQYQQSSSDYCMGNGGSYQHKVSECQQSPSEKVNYNIVRQCPRSNDYSCNTGMHHHRVLVGEYSENVGQYQLSRNGHLNNGVHEFQLNSNEYQNGVVDPQISSNFKPDGDSVESSQNRGTLEELDVFCKDGKVKEAVEVLGLLEKQGIPVDLPRYFLLMSACGETKAIQEAKSVHEHLIRSVSPLKISTYNRILEMYSRCGSMEDAFTVFNEMPKRNITSWDTMITWLAKNDLGEDAIDLFTQFKMKGLQPDAQMFIGVFSACSVVGDIDEGMLHFESMRKEYGIVPSLNHYVSVVHMLGSSGCLDEALEFIENMSSQPSVDIWETLMNLCRIHGNMELGDRCAELVELLDSSRLTEQSKVGLIPVTASDLAKEKEKKRLASQNLLEVKSRIHEYRAGDTSNPDSDAVYTQLRGLKAHMKEVGYVPQIRYALHDVDPETKEEALFKHSERLAVAHGLLSSPARSPIRVIKNLRFCGDCHAAMKIISKLVGRVLIIRDVKRFHHFKDGICSCGDYW